MALPLYMYIEMWNLNCVFFVWLTTFWMPLFWLRMVGGKLMGFWHLSLFDLIGGLFDRFHLVICVLYFRLISGTIASICLILNKFS